MLLAALPARALSAGFLQNVLVLLQQIFGGFPQVRGKRDARSCRQLLELICQVSDAIEREHRRLQKASAVLSCFHVAALYQDWHEEAIVASDVVLVVRNLVEDAIRRLDLTALTREVREPTESRAATDGDSSPAD